MKEVKSMLYEAGDHVLIMTGYNKGKPAIVVAHPKPNYDVAYKVAGQGYDEDEDAYDEYGDDGDYHGEYTSSPAQYLKYITKLEYDKLIKTLKVVEIKGLPVGVKFLRGELVIGYNVVKPAEAKKLADFILENIPKKGKK